MVVPVLNLGIARLPAPRLSAALTGLIVSLTCGTLTVAVTVYPWQHIETVTWLSMAAGLFTYPLATGLYYCASFAFGGRTEIAAQFAKIKPLFSATIAVGWFGERLTSLETMAVVLMVSGVVCFLVGLSR